MKLEELIREAVSAYLDGSIDAGELNARLPDGWDLDESGDQNAAELALLAIGYLAGYQAGDRSEDELRGALNNLISPTVEFVYEGGPDDFATILFTRVAEFKAFGVAGDSSLEEGFELSTDQSPQTERRTTKVLLGQP